MASSASGLLPVTASSPTPANPYHLPSLSSKLKKTPRPCHLPMSDLRGFGDSTRNTQGEPLTITSGSEVTTSAAPGAEFDPGADVRACSVASGDEINEIRSNVRTVRGIFTSLNV